MEGAIETQNENAGSGLWLFMGGFIEKLSFQLSPAGRIGFKLAEKMERNVNHVIRETAGQGVEDSI